MFSSDATHLLVLVIVAISSASCSDTVDCHSAQECRDKGDAIAFREGDRLSTGIRSRLPYYERACRYNATGQTCTYSKVLREQLIEIEEGERMIEWLKQLEQP